MHTSTIRRLPTILATAALGLLALTACGTDDSSSSKSTVTVTQSASASGTPVDATSTKSETAESVTKVDIEQFAGRSSSSGNGYFFQSPTGNINCAIKLEDPSVPPGCMSEEQLPSINGVSCPGNFDGFYLTVIENGSAVSKCEVGGTPHVAGPNSDNGLPIGGRILNPGDSLSADGVTCTTIVGDIKCTVDGTGRGFRMGVKVNETF